MGFSSFTSKGGVVELLCLCLCLCMKEATGVAIEAVFVSERTFCILWVLDECLFIGA